MRIIRKIIAFTAFLTLCQIPFQSFCQLGISFDIKKPREYEDRILQSEKTGEKKFTTPRRFIQNTVTHYNYFFNANNTLNEIIEQAKMQNQDDFTQLLAFYNYSLDNTSKNTQQLDSVIYKSTTGLVLHDLRNDWADNLYLLIGAAYYLRKDFDSAFLTFQFINYAFAKKEKDGYYQTIGSRLDGNSAVSISTREKTSLTKKIFSEPPSRNDAFIWQIRTFIAMDAYAEAASLIVTLKYDPKFPSRLQKDLAEVQALWYYKQHSYDSAAAYLEKALGNAPTKSEKTRWEYLTAQLYEISKGYEKSKEYYEKVISHTTDPVMEIYARLNAIRMNIEGGENYIDRNIADLKKMAKKDKYADYRDIIYFTIGQMELDRGNFDAAEQSILKSTSFASNNEAQRNKAFLLLGEMAYNQKKYRLASGYYDSLKLTDPSLRDGNRLMTRRDNLKSIATPIDIIERQDSLLRIAALPEIERTDYVKKLVKQLRKQQGLKDDDKSISSFLPSTPSADLFNPGSSKGEWYFYNLNLRTKGATAFKTKWGNRSNVDNWRRITAVNATAQQNLNNDRSNIAADVTPEKQEISFEALYNNLPLTAEQLAITNDSISNALFDLGKGYAEKIEDCEYAISTLESLRIRYPQFPKMDQALFTLYYCYTKTGNTDKAAAIKKIMNDQFGDSRLTSIVTTGKDPGMKNDTENPAINAIYEKIYDLFIEGSFPEAIQQKKAADSLYGSNYWSPQLLYIEAVYHIKQREDKPAFEALQNIVSKYPDHPLAEKARTLIDVLGRRKEIEEELKNLEIEPQTADSSALVTQGINNPMTSPVNNDSVKMINPGQQKTDSIIKPGDKITDTLVAAKTNINKQAVTTAYNANTGAPHFVLIILNKVDKVWGNEAINAFQRYNREKTVTQKLTASLVDLDAENKLLLIGNFDNAEAAIQYVSDAKPIAATRIVPWLTATKYSFSVISESNLELLEEKKNITEYQMFIHSLFPGKF
ncbi:MAG: hypothetical protein GC171_16560 [Terrimonas sp.]|nr:hypothetical protein [Terrimonas sp.]